ncbi:synaptopodin-2 [Polymixia lowei]
MEPEAEDPVNNDHYVTWSGSDASPELCISESMAESYNDDTVSNAEYPSDLQPTHTPTSDPESPECLNSPDRASICEQQSLPGLSGSQEDVSYNEMDNIFLGESRGSVKETPHINTLVTSPASLPARLYPEPHIGHISSASSSSSFGCGDMTLALTFTPEQPLGDSRRQGPGTGVGAREDRSVESSEEGGCCEAPPAPVSFGISGEGAEQAEKWTSESDRDLCRPDRNRARHRRFSYIESQSEKHVKETKSKCKRIARLLTDSPNPLNKGALLFKKRRQRVKKYTLVSYGTGEKELDNEDQTEEEGEQVRSVGFNLTATSDSELEEGYSVSPQEQNLNLNWENLEEMEGLSDTKGKGVTMFAQRRQRMDAIALEREELSHKGIPVEGITEPDYTEVQNTYDTEEMYYVDSSHKQNLQYQENIKEMNQLPTVPKPLVPNRTAKPFLGFQESPPASFSPGVPVPVTKKHELKFKVPVPINTSPQVWSPTGDIIASRDERISVPAIKTGILPESKRRSSNKQSSMPNQASNAYLQNKGERRSYIESEEDFFSLGAEACNFMQPRTVKLKNPPPVAPKPTKQNCPPWLGKSPSLEPFNPPRSPVSPSAGCHTQHYSLQGDWAQRQQSSNPWAPVQTQAPLLMPTSDWAPVSSPQHQLQPTMNSWSPQPPRSPVSIKGPSPTYSPHHPPSSSRNKSSNAPDSVASCPPQQRNSSKAAPASPKGQGSDRGVSRAVDGPTLMGKGAALFAKRQSRMEKFVVDADTVQANKIRTGSPTTSLPNSWRYSSNVRAPPPLSYNPLLAPFYPPSAAKTPPSTSPKIKPKTKCKPKAPLKHLSSLDVMKHQPYQLDSSLFKYDAVTEVKSPSPKTSPAPTSEVPSAPKPSSAPSYSPYNACDLAHQSKSKAPTKSSASGFGRSYSLSLPRRLNSVPSHKSLSPVSTPGFQPSFNSTRRQISWQEKTYKPPTPWEAASRSPIGSVDEAFAFPSFQSFISSDVKAAGQRKSLPEPPAEWKRRVSLDIPPVSKSHYHAAPSFQPPSTSRTFSPEKPTFYGPPFRPAQPLWSGSRVTIGYMGQGASPTKYSPLLSTVRRS